LPISKDKLIATIAEVPGFLSFKICISPKLKIQKSGVPDIHQLK
jgi:hypothetical protein